MSDPSHPQVRQLSDKIDQLKLDNKNLVQQLKVEREKFKLLDEKFNLHIQHVHEIAYGEVCLNCKKNIDAQRRFNNE